MVPAKSVLLSDVSPYDASTVLEDISVNFAGRAPEFISSARDLASSVVKLPCIITSLANASFT